MIWLLLGLVGCSTAPEAPVADVAVDADVVAPVAPAPSDVPPGEPAPKGITGPDGVVLAERPFTAAQIREENVPGLQITSRVVEEGRPAKEVVLHWVAEDGFQATTTTTVLEAGTGAVIDGPTSKTTPWSDFEGHASWPADHTRRASARVTVPLGVFDAWIYTVDGTDEAGAPTLSRFTFAKELAGPPVQVQVLQGGQLVESYDQIARAVVPLP